MSHLIEALRQVVRSHLPRTMYGALASLVNAVIVCTLEGPRTWWLLRQCQLGALDRPLSLRLKYLQFPISLRSGSSDASTVIDTVIRQEYGQVQPLSEPLWMIDAGAYIGDTSAYFLSRFPRLRVVALEPQPDNFAQASVNLAPYGRRALALQKGLWCTDAVMPFGGESTGASLSQDGVLIDCTSIQSLIRDFGIPHIDILKMDIEGAEEAIFSMMVGDWLQAVTLIIIEIHTIAAQQMIGKVLDGAGFSGMHHRSVWYYQNTAIAAAS